MNVILYKNSSPNNKVEKNLSEARTIENVRFLDDNNLSVASPVMLLNLTNDIETIMSYNYVYIPKLKRYYYIRNISTQGGLINIECGVDGLMSFKDDIYRRSQQKQYIIRQETKYKEPYLQDNLLPIRSDHGYLYKTFGKNVDDKGCSHIILETTGKGGTVA